MEFKITYFSKDLRQNYTLGKVRLIFFTLRAAKWYSQQGTL